MEKERWTELEPIRVGMLSLATRQIFGDNRYAVIWQQAIILAAPSPNALNTLAGMAAGWGWKQETEDVLWFAVTRYPSQSWPLTTLESYYTGQRDTSGLGRVFLRKLQNNLQDELARNNVAMISLLLGTDLAEAHASAAKLHAAQPKNPTFTSTYALSQYLLGHPQAAVQALRSLGLERLDDPSLAAYYGVFLAAAGDTKTAQTYLAKSAKAFLLPEEHLLVERAKKMK